MTADFSNVWVEGRTTVRVLSGRCSIRQFGTTVTADNAVLWHEAADAAGGRREFVSAYLEGDVQIDQPGATRTKSSFFHEFVSRDGVRFDVRRIAEAPATGSALFDRASRRRRIDPRGQTGTGAGGEVVQAQSIVVQPTVTRRVRIFPRTAVPYNVQSFQTRNTTPPEQVWQLTGGVNVVVDGDPRLGTVGLAADRVVIWTQATENGEFQAETVQARDVPFQLYLEGNIVVRQGDKVVRATRAFYDAREDRGTMLNAELRQPVPQLGGTLRVRADRLRQLSRNSFHAENAYATTSEFGKPGYRVQSTDIFIENRYVRPWINARDPATGQPLVEEVPWVTSLNNTVYIDDVPVFYNPKVSAPAEDPQIPLSGLTVGFDRIFGFRLNTRWDLFQLTGVDRPPGADWDLRADYYSDRGVGLGTGGSYRGVGGLFGIPGSYEGEGLFYYVNDKGTDNLGGPRDNVDFGNESRYSLTGRHRHEDGNGFALIGKVGVIGDRTFWEQYFENEFDNGEDVETSLLLRNYQDNWGVTGFLRGQVNDFTTTTDWLPRGDVYTLSEPLWWDRMTWSQHSYAGYAQLHQGEPPTDPVLASLFTPLTDPIPGSPSSPNGMIADASGGVFSTRHKLDAALDLGPLNVTPYAWGEASHWGQGFDGSGVDRLVGSVGVDFSLLMWRVFPRVQSRIFNLNGLAHKMRFEAGYAYTESTESLSNIPQYNEIDDNAQERSRQLFTTSTFGGVLPGTLDPRNYALRSGTAFNVTSPVHELVDDQHVLRLAWRHRLQTKVGPPNRLRIRDWMTLDLEGSYFPDAARDNFGEDFGLVGGRYQWFFSERTSFLASARYDFFDNAPRTYAFGLTSQRSERGSVYVGLRNIKGGADSLESNIVTASYSYQMSPKWVSSFGTAYDLNNNLDLGQSLTVTRIGRDFLTHVGFSYVGTKDNVGVLMMIEPRFGRVSSGPLQLSSLLGPGG